MLWSGTLVTQGTARGLVVATGQATEIGRIGGLLAGVEQLTTPLVAQIDHFARWLSFLILLLAGGLLVWGYYVGHMPFADLFMAVVGIAVAAIPEGLPAVMTITLAIGVQAMARRHAIVRRLPAIEAIGSVSVICTDKTGTLTRNEMMVAAAETAEGIFAIGGEGYAPEGAMTPAGDLSRLARAAALCNDGGRRPDGRSTSGICWQGRVRSHRPPSGRHPLRQSAQIHGCSDRRATRPCDPCEGRARACAADVRRH
jgi:magnesium-transporting ATPase (P-type)